MRLSHDLPSRVCRVLFAVLMLMAWTGAAPAQQEPPAQQQPPQQSPPLQPSKPGKLARDLEQVFPVLEAVQRALPRDTFDAAAVVEAVGKDPATLLRWVRENTAWVPYRGSLRGPTGTLMDRLGNSLDRSLLLGELLRVAGKEVRLARAELDDRQAAEMRKAAATRPAPAPPQDGPGAAAATSASIEAAAKELGLDPADARQKFDQLPPPHSGWRRTWRSG